MFKCVRNKFCFGHAVSQRDEEMRASVISARQTLLNGFINLSAVSRATVCGYPFGLVGGQAVDVEC